MSGDRPLTTTFLVGGLLWALWHWRRTRLIAAPAGSAPLGKAGAPDFIPSPAPPSALPPAPFDAGKAIGKVTG
jgi:hypothetical protein